MKSFKYCKMNLNNSNKSVNLGCKQYITSLLIIISFVFIPVILNAQAIKNFKDSSCVSAARPMLLKQGDKVLVSCDTAYLINAYRYRLYEKAKRHLITLAGNTDKMASQVEGSVNQLDNYFSEIQSRYFLLSEEVKKSQSENVATLNRVNLELDQTRNDLQATRNDLEAIRNSLKKARRKDMRNRLVFGGVGLGAGLLLGAILLN